MKIAFIITTIKNFDKKSNNSEILAQSLGFVGSKEKMDKDSLDKVKAYVENFQF